MTTYGFPQLTIQEPDGLPFGQSTAEENGYKLNGSLLDRDGWVTVWTKTTWKPEMFFGLRVFETGQAIVQRREGEMLISFGPFMLGQYSVAEIEAQLYEFPALHDYISKIHMAAGPEKLIQKCYYCHAILQDYHDVSVIGPDFRPHFYEIGSSVKVSPGHTSTVKDLPNCAGAPTII
jgi:hypothetical protein